MHDSFILSTAHTSTLNVNCYCGENLSYNGEKMALQMPQPHRLQASEKHHEVLVVTLILGSQNIKSVAMAIVARR